MIKDKIGIVLVGIGGYGMLYVNEILDHLQEGRFELCGVADPFPANCSRYAEIVKLGIPVTDNLEDFYKQYKADLAIISTPIQYHCPNTCTALSHGSHVLCEKPVAATLQEVGQMERQRDKAGRQVSVGYQWSYSNAVQSLKKDILAGRFGQCIRMKSIVLWPRYRSYYERGWAGKKKDSAGNWVLDSVAANATAHYLHNMFYLLGDSIDRSAVLKSVTAETYRANQIENYDTAALRAYTDKGTEILFLAAHPIEPEAIREPEFEYEFEQGVISYCSDGKEQSASIRAILKDGTEINYGNPFEKDTAKFWSMLDAIQYETKAACGLEAASVHTQCIQAVQESVPDARTFPEEIICRDQDRKITWVRGLADTLNQAYAQWKMPWELGAQWSVCGKEATL